MGWAPSGVGDALVSAILSASWRRFSAAAADVAPPRRVVSAECAAIVAAEAGGGPMTADRVKFWEIFGTLKWGIMCMTMYKAFATGADASFVSKSAAENQERQSESVMAFSYAPPRFEGRG